MKKVISVFFVTLASASTAFSQSSSSQDVTGNSAKLYGVVDVGVANYFKSNGNVIGAMHAIGSGSRIGFLSTEDIGQGTFVRARLEEGINLQDGSSSSTQGLANRVFGRQAYVEIGNRHLGSIQMGRLQGPSYNFFSPRTDSILSPAMDAWGVLTTQGSGLPGIGGQAGFMINPTMRTSSTISYITPAAGGVQGQVAYSFRGSSQTQPNYSEATLTYTGGHLQANALLVHASSTPAGGTGGAATRPVTEWALGGNYDFGFAALFLTYEHRNVTDPTLNATGSALTPNASSVKIIGLAIPVSERGSIRLDYGRLSNGVANSNATNYGIAYMYTVNKHMFFMAAATRLTQGSNSNMPIFVSGTPGAGRPITATILGLDYMF